MESINSRFAGFNGAYSCGGNIENPMFRNIAPVDRFYIQRSSRNARRHLEKLRRRNRKKLSTKRIRISSPNRRGGFSK